MQVSITSTINYSNLQANVRLYMYNFVFVGGGAKSIGKMDGGPWPDWPHGSATDYW